MDPVITSFCEDCDWLASSETVADRSKAMLNHALETGHDISTCEVTLIMDRSIDSTKHLNVDE